MIDHSLCTTPKQGRVRYAYGQDRAHTAGRCPPTYTPLADDEAATAAWTAEDVAEWRALPEGGW